jgi:hypothetical protein
MLFIQITAAPIMIVAVLTAPRKYLHNNPKSIFVRIRSQQIKGMAVQNDFQNL